MMIRPSLETIREQHQALLSKSAKMAKDDIPQVETFVDSVAKAGEYSEDTDQRSYLLALIRYWGGFINDKQEIFLLTFGYCPSTYH